jgi:hypothetical protein
MAMLDDAAVDLMLRKARIQNGWLDTPVTDDQLQACNVGHGDPAKVMPKLPRLDFDEACTLL